VTSSRHPFLAVFVVAGLIAPFCAAHDPLLDLPEPKSVPEAWNVINASVENVGKLFETGQLREIAFQIANCSPAIRRLQANLPPDDVGQARRAELQEMFGLGANIIIATREKDRPREKGQALYPAYLDRWQRIAAHYGESERNANVYVCPMHPLDRHLDRDARCTDCGMILIRRRIPASTTYEKPGAPSMKLLATPDAPLRPGRRAQVRIRLSKLDGTPVREEDLVVMHEQRMHLLIIDQSLTDYHHEHPTPTNNPGEFEFTFTPRRPGPYRAWADVVPGETAVQEFVMTDIPGESSGKEITDRNTKLVDTVDGLRYELTFETKGAPLRVGEVVKGRIAVTDSKGEPFRGLEPIMGAYAHLVGFAVTCTRWVRSPRSQPTAAGLSLSSASIPRSRGLSASTARSASEGRQSLRSSA
jgi:hypothetical protein